MSERGDSRTVKLVEAKTARESAAMETAAMRARLPFKYLRQQAHLTAPTNDLALAEKSIRSAMDVSRRLLDKYGISTELLAESLDVSPDVVTAVTESGITPLVVLDLEDGVPPKLVPAARENAIRLFSEADWGRTLRYFRPAGLEDPRGVDDVVNVLLGAASNSTTAETYPIDGLVFPKVRHAHEVRWLYALLDDIERDLKLPPNQIRVTYQVETGWGVQHIAQLAEVGISRLSGLVLGTVDLAADLQIRNVHYRHPICEWARHMIVSAGGAAGVPAIDGMTLNFPVPLRDAGPDVNRAHILARMAENFADARYSIERGMSGRWVGHPLQLIATLIAFRSEFTESAIEQDIEELARFKEAMSADLGAVAGAHGELLDIGTDRLVRRKLRQAVAWGYLDRERAVDLDVISTSEASDM